MNQDKLLKWINEQIVYYEQCEAHGIIIGFQKVKDYIKKLAENKDNVKVDSWNKTFKEQEKP